MTKHNPLDTSDTCVAHHGLTVKEFGPWYATRMTHVSSGLHTVMSGNPPDLKSRVRSGGSIVANY